MAYTGKRFLQQGKKALILFSLIFLVISQTNLGVVYAQSVSQLATQKEQSIDLLDKVEVVVDKTIDKLDEKINDEREDRLREKEEEIGDYIEEVQEKIEKENSGSDVKKLVAEAKKVVVLKVVSGATEYEDINDSISNDVASTRSEKKEAKKVLQESMETGTGDYSIMIKTKYSQSQLKSLFDKFDTRIKLESMYSDGGENYFEVSIDEDSIFRQEMLEDIESGNLPETFFGVEIIFPEVFSIGEIPHPNPLLQGEGIDQTWGVASYKAYDYLGQGENASIKVGVVDTGIDYNHPDLTANVSGGYDFVNDDGDAMDDQGHGTHVAGTIAANINGQGIIGVNPNADLIPLKICNARGFCPSYAVLRALDYATQENIDILNMSLGGRGTVTDHPICAGISAYTDAGGIVVSASGNSNIDTSQFVPGGCTDAITVAAVDSSGNRASFSNYGSKVDVAAPGVSVYSTYPGNQYRNLSGTSMAAPHIAGLVSLVQKNDSDITASEVKSLLKKYSKNVSTDAGKTIASGVDVTALMLSFTEDSSVVEVVLEEEEETIVVAEEVIEGNDIATIDSSIDFEAIPKITQINLNPEGVEINSEEDTSEPILIEERIESLQNISLEGFSAPESGSVEINTDDLPEIEVKEISVEEFDTTSIKEIYIVGEDGTQVEKSDIEINSIEDSEEELVEIDVDIATGSLLTHNNTDSVQMNLTGEQGIEINNAEPLQSIEEVIEENQVEIIQTESSGEDSIGTGAVLIDEVVEGATIEPIVLEGLSGESGVEINSIGSDTFTDIEEIVVGEIVIEEQEDFEESGIEINSLDEEIVDDDGGLYEELGENFNELEIDELPIEESGIEINNSEEEFYEKISEDEISTQEGFGIQSALQGDENGLIAEYLLDGNTDDTSINNNHGTLHGATWKTATIEERKLLGQDKYLSIGKNTTNYVELPDGIVDGLTDFSISFWVKRTDDASYYQVLNAYNNKLLVGFYYDSIAAVTNAVYGDRINTKHNFRYKKNSWNHYSITVEGDVMKVYENGRFLASKNRTPKTITGATGLVIGQEQDAYHGGYDANQSLAGDIANLKIFNTSISEQQARNIYYNGDITDNSENISIYHEGKITTELPENIRYIRDHLTGSDKNTGSYWIDIQAMNHQGVNVAKGKPVLSPHAAHADRPYSRITDENLTYYSNPTVYGSPTFVVVDLESQQPVNMVKVWHYYKDDRTFNGTKTEVSADGIHWYVLHDSEVDGTYIEPKNASGRTYELRNTISEKPSQVRYIRDHANGSNRNGGSHWVEIQAYDENGVNVAKGKGVASKYVPNTSTRPHTRLTDESLSYGSRIASKYQDTWMQVDLGELYDLEMLKVWHYYNDGSGPGRIYNDTKTEISEDGTNWYSLFDSTIDGTYVEPKDGSGKIYRLTDDPIKKICVVNLGRYCDFKLHHALRYDYTVSEGGVVRSGKNDVIFRTYGDKIGRGTMAVSKNDITYYEVDVEVIPAHITHNQTLKIGQSFDVEVPDADRYDIEVSNGGIIKTQVNSRKIHVDTIDSGNTKLYLKYKGVVAATININVESTPTFDPDVVEYHNLSIMRKRSSGVRLDLPSSFYTYTISQGGIIEYPVPSGTYLTIKSLQEGDVRIYAKRNGSDDVAAIIDVEVTENINTEVVTCTIGVGTDCDITLDNANTYFYSVSQVGRISYASNSSLLRITGENAGSVTLYVRRSDGSLAYQINIYVASTIPTYDIELYEGQEMKMYLNSASLYEYSMTKKGVAGLYNGDGSNNIYVKGYLEGNVMLYAERTNFIIALNITVIPKPKEYECIVEVGMSCYLNLYRDHNLHRYAQFSVANPDVIRQTWDRTDVGEQLTIDGLKEGIGYMSITRLEEGTHNVKIKVVPIDSTNKSGKCDLDLNQYCDIDLRSIGDYELTVSNPGVVTTFGGTNKYSIYGTASGETDVYIKKDGITVHTVRIKVSDIQNLSLGTSRMNVETGEDDYFLITSGNGGYRVYKDNDNVSVYATSDENRFRVRGNKVGRSTIVVYDSENKTNRFTAYVTDGGNGEQEATETDFTSLEYEAIPDLGLGFLSFEVSGVPGVVGIEYKDNAGQVIRQSLGLTSDGIYRAIIDQNEDVDTASAYESFIPYFIKSNGELVYYDESGSYLTFADNTPIQLTSVEDGVEVNGLSNNHNVWKSDLLKDDVKTIIDNKVLQASPSQSETIKLLVIVEQFEHNFKSKTLKDDFKLWFADYLKLRLKLELPEGYCESYRSGLMSLDFYKFGGYEELCDTLLGEGIINLPNTAIKTRKEWGATYTQGDYYPNWSPLGITPDIYNYFYINKSSQLNLDTIVIHHTTDGQYQDIAKLEDKMRKDDYYSLGYHFIIDGNGVIYEGRPLEFKGDHVESGNTGKIGIALMGDFESRALNGWNPDTPTDNQILSLKKLSKDLANKFGISSDKITGHNDHLATSCPGDNLESRIHDVKDYVNN